MPIVDNDIIVVTRTSRAGATNIEVGIRWTDGITGEVKGSFGYSWADVESLKQFLNEQSDMDLVRNLLLQCYNQSTGALRASVFDALGGKTFRMQARVQEIVP